jgi:hypothetical protein
MYGSLDVMTHLYDKNSSVFHTSPADRRLFWFHVVPHKVLYSYRRFIAQVNFESLNGFRGDELIWIRILVVDL